MIPRLHGSVLAEAQRLYEEALSMEMDAVLRFDEYYSQGAPVLPRVDELIGQNGLDRNRLRGTPVGSLEDGFSNPNTV